MSYNSQLYGIETLNEAKAYLFHPILGSRLIEITKVLLELENKNALEIMGRPDDMKLRSCMTLFERVDQNNKLFSQVIDLYFDGKRDYRTLKMMGY